MIRPAAIAGALLLSGCAGLPVGPRTFVFVGVGVVRVDRTDKALGVSSRSLGLTLGCRQITLGALASYCAQIPLSASLAIIEHGAGPDQHLKLSPLHPQEGSGSV